MADTVIEPGLIEADEAPKDLPPHVLRLARMIARDCAVPGDYTINLNIPDRPREPATIQIARKDVLREGKAERK